MNVYSWSKRALLVGDLEPPPSQPHSREGTSIWKFSTIRDMLMLTGTDKGVLCEFSFVHDSEKHPVATKQLREAQTRAEINLLAKMAHLCGVGPTKN